nr:Hint domain-containing protein [Aliiroseovarius subalbicans]
MPVPPRETRLRLTYAWDAPARRGWISVENLDQETLYQAEFDAPVPLPVADAREIIANGDATRIGRETRYLALSDHVEPVGLSPGVAKGTPVETPTGPRLIERLRLGDLVTTATGHRPVRWITRREVPARGGFRPILIRAPYFGLSRDILVAPDHRVVVAGAEAEYLFGEDSVLVEARHLVDGQAVMRTAGGGTLWYYHVLLDTHECLTFAGLDGESLFVGAMGRAPEMIATTSLADMPSEIMPRHKAFAQPILSGYEARTLAASMVA